MSPKYFRWTWIYLISVSEKFWLIIIILALELSASSWNKPGPQEAIVVGCRGTINNFCQLTKGSEVNPDSEYYKVYSGLPQVETKIESLRIKRICYISDFADSLCWKVKWSTSKWFVKILMFHSWRINAQMLFCFINCSRRERWLSHSLEIWEIHMNTKKYQTARSKQLNSDTETRALSSMDASRYFQGLVFHRSFRIFSGSTMTSLLISNRNYWNSVWILKFNRIFSDTNICLYNFYRFFTKYIRIFVRITHYAQYLLSADH